MIIKVDLLRTFYSIIKISSQVHVSHLCHFIMFLDTHDEILRI